MTKWLSCVVATRICLRMLEEEREGLFGSPNTAVSKPATRAATRCALLACTGTKCSR